MTSLKAPFPVRWHVPVVIRCVSWPFSGRDDLDMVVDTSEVRSDLHFPINEVVLHKDGEPRVGVAGSSRGVGVRHGGDS
jgi:hypothetical protein